MNKERAAYQLVTVYEAVNADMREVYLGTTPLLMPELIEAFLRRPPAGASHWKELSAVSFRGLEYSVPRHEAQDLMRQLSVRPGLIGWRLILEGS